MAGNPEALHVPINFSTPPEGWRWERLDSISEGVIDCPHSTPQVTADGPLMARSQDIRSGVFLADQAAHVSEETYSDRIARAEPRYGDLLYSREGTYFGIAAEVPPSCRVCLGQRMVLIRPDPCRADHRFLRYWLNSPALSQHIHGFRDGSVAERLNMATIRSLPVLLPPLAEQQGVSRILGSFDDKIELNRRTNRALEEMARAIFKAWFVDFEPVKAKAEGATSFPGMPQAVFNELPDTFEESEIGPIPAGWSAGTMSKLVELIGGGTPKRKVAEYWGGDIPWYSVKDVPSSEDVWVNKTAEYVTDTGIANSSARVMLPGTTIISARGTVGRLALTAVPMAMNQSCYGVRGANGVGDYFVYFALKNAVAELQQRTHGSVFDTITRKTFDFLKRPVPAPTILQSFEEAVEPLLLQIKYNVDESLLLGETRDTLLPKLISGQLRVPATEETPDG